MSSQNRYDHGRTGRSGSYGPAVTCNTADAGSSELPAGYYYIGDHYLHGPHRTPWFNLYRQRSSGGGFWDYYTQVPELGCRGGFGLHSGGYSEGCITVTNSNCFTRLTNEIISNFPVIYSMYMNVAIAIKDGGDLDIDVPGLRLLVVPALLIYSLIIKYNVLIFQTGFFCSNYKI